MYEHYLELARRLGWRVSPPDPGIMTLSFALDGELDGHPGLLVRTNGSAENVSVSAPIVPELELGLNLGPTDFIVGLFGRLIGMQEINIGDERFDAAFAIRADDEGRARALLTPLTRAIGSLMTVHVTDAQVKVDVVAAEENVNVLEQQVRATIALAKAIEAACAHVPPASPAHYEACQSFAEQHGLALTATPLRMSGRFGRALVGLRLVRKAKDVLRLHLSCGAEHALSEPVALRSRAHSLDSGGMHLAKVKTGDEAFDERFEIHTDAALTTVLDDELRRRLLELSAMGEVYFDERGVSLYGAIPPQNIAPAFEMMRAIVELRFVLGQAYR